MKYGGRCDCGNLGFEFTSAFAPAALPLRTCQCSFCRAHGVVSTSDPDGSITIRVVDSAAVSRYRFGLGITDFLICRHCGVYVLAQAEMDARHYAVLNANVLDCRSALRHVPQAMDYGAENVVARRARRKARWTPVIREDGG